VRVWVLVWLSAFVVVLYWVSLASRRPEAPEPEHLQRPTRLQPGPDSDVRKAVGAGELANALDEPDAADDANYATACFSDKCHVAEPDHGPANVTLLIGIVSDTQKHADFREAARATWVPAARALSSVQVVFFFPEQHPVALEEKARHNDVVFGSDTDRYMPVGYRMLQHFVAQYHARHILRVDVRSYVAVSRLLHRLDKVCSRPACEGEDIWAGRQVTNREVSELEPAYQFDTGLSMYLPYMSEGAYIISSSLASALVLMHNNVGLKPFHAEDISMGVWLIPIAARRIDLSPSFHVGSVCCIKDGQTDRPLVDICEAQSDQLPIVLNLLEKPEYLRIYHEALQACG
jgi:Galactosyltransferase